MPPACRRPSALSAGDPPSPPPCPPPCPRTRAASRGCGFSTTTPLPRRDAWRPSCTPASPARRSAWSARSRWTGTIRSGSWKRASAPLAAPAGCPRSATTSATRGSTTCAATSWGSAPRGCSSGARPPTRSAGWTRPSAPSATASNSRVACGWGSGAWSSSRAPPSPTRGSAWGRTSACPTAPAAPPRPTTGCSLRPGSPTSSSSWPTSSAGPCAASSGSWSRNPAWPSES